MSHIEVFQRTDGKWDWHLKAANGEILCGSVQGYRDETDARRGYVTTAKTMVGVYEIRTVEKL